MRCGDTLLGCLVWAGIVTADTIASARKLKLDCLSQLCSSWTHFRWWPKMDFAPLSRSPLIRRSAGSAERVRGDVWGRFNGRCKDHRWFTPGRRSGCSPSDTSMTGATELDGDEAVSTERVVEREGDVGATFNTPPLRSLSTSRTYVSASGDRGVGKK